MRVIVELSDAEENGIKDYLREVDGIKNPKRKDVKTFIDGMVQSIHAPQEAVSDYIKRHLPKMNID